MLSKFIQILYSNKLFLVLQALCYMVAVASFGFAYSCTKEIVYDNLGTTEIYIVFKSPKKISEIDTLVQKITNENIGGYFYIDFGNEVYTPYNNITLKEKKFDGDAKEIILQKGFDAGAKVGDDVSLNGKSYKVIGYSKKHTMINYNSVEKDSLATRVIFNHRKPFSDKDNDILDAIFAGDSTIRYFVPPQINSIAEVAKNPIFIIGIAIVFLGMTTLSILVFYSISLRKKLFDLLIALEYPAKKTFGVMAAEQAIIVPPMYLLSLALYFILYAFMYDIMAMLTFWEIFAGLCLTMAMSLTLTFVAFAGFWRKRNV